MPLDRAEALHLFEYDAWANLRSEAALRALAEPTPEMLRQWGHLIGVQELWLARILGEDARAVVVWPVDTLAGFVRARAHVAERWRAHLADLTPAELERKVAFVNSAGEPQNDPVEAILRQVVLHGVHHRAQLATLLRAQGARPPGVDYVMWRRELARAAGP